MSDRQPMALEVVSTEVQDAQLSRLPPAFLFCLAVTDQACRETSATR